MEAQEKVHITVAVISQGELVCHMEGHTCTVLLYLSQTHRLREASSNSSVAVDSYILPGTGQQEKTSLGVEQCTIMEK